MRRAAARSQCANSLKQVALSIHGYHDATGQFPAGTIGGTYLPPDERLSFHAAILPYLEQDVVFRQLKLDERWNSDANRLAVGELASWYRFQCADWTRERWFAATGRQNPERGHDAFTNYIGVVGLGLDAASRPLDAPGIGMFGYDRKLEFEQIKDGSSNTMMLIETGHEVGPWLRGGPSTVRGLDLDAGHLTGDGLPFGGTHFLDSTVIRKQKPDGFHIVRGDGSVRYTKNDVRPAILAALATVAGKEEIPTDW